MSRSNEDPRGLVLHVVVVGFHHKKGCQVEFSYPPLVPGESHDSKKLPEEWKYLPFLALPDGAHNYQEDVIYFLLPARQGEKKCVYAVSCYKQIEAKALKVREADVTRDMVQKSVCVLSSEPFFGLLQAKLKLITHAYFEEKDFSQISILKGLSERGKVLQELYEHVNSSLNGSILDGSPAYLGISSRDLVLKFKQKVLVLFKLILLEKKVLFIGSPVEKLVSPMMSLLSLFPGIIEYGLAKASGYRPRLSVSTNSRQHSTDNTSPPVPVTNGSNESPGSEASVSSSDGRTDSAELLQPPGSGGTGRLRISLASSESDWETLEPGMLEIESAGGTTGPPTPEGALEDDAVDVETDVVKQEEEVNRSAEMLSGLEENDHGMPLAIFTKGYLFMPYMALQQHHLLADVSIRGFLAGATNIIFRQQRHLSDVIVDVATAQLEVQDPELRRILELSTADLRFTDWLLRHVSEPASEDLFLNGTDWEGGDEWVRAQFALYMDSLLASTLQPDNERIIADFGIGFMSMWQNTHNYRVWHGREHPGMAEVAEGHPFQGQYSVSDVKLRLAHSVQNSERGKKIGNAVLTTGRSMVQTSKAVGHSVGGALQNARSAVSTWFSGLTQPGTAPDPPGTAPDPPGTAPDPPGTAPDPPGVAPDPPGAEKS